MEVHVQLRFCILCGYNEACIMHRTFRNLQCVGPQSADLILGRCEEAIWGLNSCMGLLNKLIEFSVILLSFLLAVFCIYSHHWASQKVQGFSGLYHLPF